MFFLNLQPERLSCDGRKLMTLIPSDGHEPFGPLNLISHPHFPGSHWAEAPPDTNDFRFFEL